jgi:hypothetical protein
MSETVTATATAYASSGVRAPATMCWRTCTGRPIEARMGRETSRLSAASPANRATSASATRSGASRGSRWSAASTIARAFWSPRTSTPPTSGSEICPPRTMTPR